MKKKKKKKKKTTKKKNKKKTKNAKTNAIPACAAETNPTCEEETFARKRLAMKKGEQQEQDEAIEDVS